VGKLVLCADALIGDSLMVTPAIRAYKEAHPETDIWWWSPGIDQGEHMIGNEAVFYGNRNLDLVLPRGSEFEPEPDDKMISLSCADAFQWGVQHRRTLAEGYGPQLGVSVTDIRYDYTIDPEIDDEPAVELIYRRWGTKPFVLIARHSASCSSNDERCGYVANKCVPPRLWLQVAEWLTDQGYIPVAVGAKRELADSRYAEWVGDKLYGEPIRVIAALTRYAAATLSVDTGIRHLAAAAGGHMGCISGAIPLQLIRCVPSQEGQRIVEEHRPVSLVTRKTLIDIAKRTLGMS
jgi:hypothetical protein